MFDIDLANLNYTENLYQSPRVEIVCEYCEKGVNPENAYEAKGAKDLDFCSDKCAEDWEIEELASNQEQIENPLVKHQGGCQTVCIN